LDHKDELGFPFKFFLVFKVLHIHIPKLQNFILNGRIIFWHEYLTWLLERPYLGCMHCCHVKKFFLVNEVFGSNLGQHMVNPRWAQFRFAIWSFLAWFWLRFLPKVYVCVNFESIGWFCNLIHKSINWTTF
jgi:hypothetical protein